MTLGEWLGLAWPVSGYVLMYLAVRRETYPPEAWAYRWWAPPVWRWRRTAVLLTLLLPICGMAAILCGPFTWIVYRWNVRWEGAWNQRTGGGAW